MEPFLGVKPQLDYSVLVFSSLSVFIFLLGKIVVQKQSDKAYIVYYTFPVKVKLGGDLKVNLDCYVLGLVKQQGMAGVKSCP